MNLLIKDLVNRLILFNNIEIDDSYMWFSIEIAICYKDKEVF